MAFHGNLSTYTGNEVTLTTCIENTQENSDSTSSNQPQRIIALVLGVIGICGNVISLVAIRRVSPNQLSANLRLVVSLCFSDMLTSIGVIVYIFIEHDITNSVSQIQMEEEERVCLSISLRCFRMFTHIISLFNLGGLALDHYCALVKPLEYPQVMSRTRANIMILVFWIISLLLGFSNFAMPIFIPSYCRGNLKTMSYCEIIYCSQFDSEYIVFFMTFLSLLAMLVVYISIYYKLKYSVIDQDGYHNQRRNRRGLITTILIMTTFLCCWLPYCLFEIILTFKIRYSNDLHFWLRNFKLIHTLDFYLYDLLLLNAIADPLIYAKRMTEVRTGYRFLRQRLLDCRRNQNSSGQDFACKHRLIMKDSKVNGHYFLRSLSTTNGTTSVAIAKV